MEVLPKFYLVCQADLIFNIQSKPNSANKLPLELEMKMDRSLLIQQNNHFSTKFSFKLPLQWEKGYLFKTFSSVFLGVMGDDDELGLHTNGELWFYETGEQGERKIQTIKHEKMPFL